MIALGVTEDPISVASLDLAFQNWNFTGALTGLPAIGDETLKLSVLTPVAPMIEKMPLERAPEAYDRMIKGDARFRIVLTMGAWHENEAFNPFNTLFTAKENLLCTPCERFSPSPDIKTSAYGFRRRSVPGWRRRSRRRAAPSEFPVSLQRPAPS